MRNILIFLAIIFIIVPIIFLNYYFNTVIHNKNNDIISMFYFGLSIKELLFITIPSFLVAVINTKAANIIINSIIKKNFLVNVNISFVNLHTTYLITIYILFIITFIFLFSYTKIKKIYRDIHEVW